MPIPYTDSPFLVIVPQERSVCISGARLVKAVIPLIFSMAFQMSFCCPAMKFQEKFKVCPSVLGVSYKFYCVHPTKVVDFRSSRFNIHIGGLEWTDDALIVEDFSNHIEFV
jgi:hypothetical protein